MILSDRYSSADRATQRLAARLALKGATVIGAYAPSVVADWSVYCDEPVRVCRMVKSGRGRRPLEVSFPAPCRKCAKCLLFRRMRWRQRIINELIQNDDAGRRSWLLSLTFSPPHLAIVLAEAKALVRGGKPHTEAVEQAAYGHVQRFLKRLRKLTGSRLRYIAVPEYGEANGRLHFHLVVHELDKPLLKRAIQSCWHSFSGAKLVDCSGNRGIAGAASYVSKYVSKQGGKVRASTRYGHPPENMPALRQRSLF